MNVYTVARKYSQSLFIDSQELGLSLDEVRKNLGDLDTMLSAKAGLTHFLEHPVISLEEKRNVLKSLLGETLSPLVLEFIELLIENKRLGLMGAIIRIFDELICESKKMRKVRVDSAFELNVDGKARIESALKKKFKTEVSVEYGINPSLIGGVLIQSDDYVLDNSVKKKLLEMSLAF